VFRWKKLGRIFNPVHDKYTGWIQEYAQCPTPMILSDEVLRVYVACRPARDGDLLYVSQPGYVDLCRKDIFSVLGVSEEPLLPLGNPGTFDQFGIMPSTLVQQGKAIYAYYSGWTRMKTVPYTLAIGVAKSVDGGTHFERIGEGPVLTIGPDDPYFVTGPVVRIVDGVWHMWLLSCKDWKTIAGKAEPIYRLVTATSEDGLSWKRNASDIIPAHTETECQDICAPFFHKGLWHAFFAWRDPLYRSGKYQLGYASSADLLSWERDDSKAGISLSETGWDSEMMCYPQIIEVDGRVLMFYCGNDFGREGFGAAELELSAASSH